jgi:hypothetical protein
VRDLAGQQQGMMGHGVGQAAVHHRQAHALDVCEHRQWSACRDEGLNLLGRGCRIRRRDAVDDESMVAGEHHQLRRVQPWLERVLHQAEPHCQRLEFAKAARRRVASHELLPQRLLERRVEGRCDQ